jgi:hypothetical protein
MLEMQKRDSVPTMGPPRPAGTPVRTDDGRPFTCESNEPADKLSMWLPDPPLDGDPVFCCGARVGTFRDNGEQRPGYSGQYIETVPTKEMPPALAALMRERR